MAGQLNGNGRVHRVVRQHFDGYVERHGGRGDVKKRHAHGVARLHRCRCVEGRGDRFTCRDVDIVDDERGRAGVRNRHVPHRVVADGHVAVVVCRHGHADGRGAGTAEVHLVERARVGADLTVAIPEVAAVEIDARGFDVLRGMAFEQASALVDLVKHMVIIVGHPEVAVLQADVPGLFAGRLELCKDGAAAVDLVYRPRVGIIGTYPEIAVVVGNARHVVVGEGDGGDDVAAEVELGGQGGVGAARGLVDDPDVLPVPGHAV